MTNKYFDVHDNGGRPFRVQIVSPTEVKIFVRIDIEFKLIKTYKNVEKKFIGNSPVNEMTRFSGGYGPKFRGNSILLKLKSSSPMFRYVFIGDSIYEFSTVEPILKFTSPVGNNDVPYPLAVSKNLVYFMLNPPKHYKDPKKIVGGEIVAKSVLGKNISYEMYYQMFDKIYDWQERSKMGAKLMKKTKLIHERIF